MKRPIVAIAALSLPLVFAAAGPRTVSAQENQAGNAIQRTLDRARTAQSDPANEAYAGWLAYLARRIENEKDRPSSERPRNLGSASVDDLLSTLTEWLDRIDSDPEAWATLRGRHEWAYLSKVDGTGQPFSIAIPEAYDPERAWPVAVSLHGFGGSHIIGEGDWPESFIWVIPLGRNRGGLYHALSEVDVLEVLEYVRSHWHVDPDRIQLDGCSMGGYGTWTLGSRHPDLFASAQSVGGYFPAGQVENMLNVPLYNLHSLHDRSISITESREPTQRLEEFGGRVVMHEDPGSNHCFRITSPERVRAAQWAFRQTRPQTVQRVHYTAVDELARGAYWAEIVEWGPEGRPASFDARFSPANFLHLTLDNVEVVKIDLAASPADQEHEMTLVINRVMGETVTPPLPDSLFIIQADGGWRLSEATPAAPPQRLHFPGGAMALFHGEPIMIVWATQGDEETNRRIYDIAQLARRSHSPTWWGEEGVNPLFQMPYGQLPGKPDVEVTAEDMAKHNLLLFGDASENTIVAQLADRLPVRIANGRVRASDGFSWSFEDRGLGLLYYNPLAPQRLVYWVAFDEPESYKPGSGLTGLWAEPAPADFLLMTATTPNAFVAARRFDSRWNWESGYGESPLVSDEGSTETGYASALARVLRLAVGGDFALVDLAPGTGAEGMRLVGEGETRKMDLVAAEYDRRIMVMDLTGQEILATVQALEEMVGEFPFHDRMLLLPDPRTLAVELDHLYRVAVKGWTLHWAIDRALERPDFRATGHSVREAIKRFWPVVKR